MECYGKQIWTNLTKGILHKLGIDLPDEAKYKAVKARWDAIAKPLDGMGRFEEITAQIGAVTGDEALDLSRKAVLIFCADNGIVAEGVSQSGQEVTFAVAQSMAKKNSSVGRMASCIGADTIPVDIGINSDAHIDGVLDRKIARGTHDFLLQPAMSEAETLHAIETGIDLVTKCKADGYRILATGEMGIGNTTTSSAVAAALLGCESALVVGRGAGLSDRGLARKREVVDLAIEKYDLYHQDAFTILMTVGGFDIAGLVGMCIGGAICHIPIVLDGVISMVAALVAERMIPGVRDYVIASHKGREPAVERLAKELHLHPVIDADLALGEGTGAVMMLSLLDTALCIYREETTFADISIAQYERF